MSLAPSTKFNFTSTFTKGGQVSLHNLRMLRQVLGITLLVTLLAGVIFWGVKTWFDYTPYQRYVIRSVYVAHLRTDFSLQKKQVTQLYRYEDGRVYHVRSMDLVAHPLIQRWIGSLEARMRRNALHALGFMGLVFLSLCFVWLIKGKAKAQKQVLRGTALISPTELRQRICSDHMDSSLKLADVPLIKNTETHHMLIIGTTGTGKTNCFHELLQQVRAQGQRAIIVDMTGSFMERYYRPGLDKILNPWDARTEAWNLWKECLHSAHLRLVAATLISADGRGHESYWVKSSRAVFVATAEKLRGQDTLTTPNFFKYATHYPIREVQSFYKNTSVAAIMNGEAAETVMGVRSNLRAYTECLELFAQREREFSIRQWITQEASGEWLFLSSPPEWREEMAPLMALWMTLATHALMSLEPSYSRRLWIAIDELPALKKVPSLPTLLAEVRKYGGCAVLGMQDMSQLDEIYGPNTVKSIANLCNTKVVFRVEGAEVAERLSKWLGVQEVSETVENISYGAHQMRDGVSLNDQRKEKPTVHPDQLMKLPDLEAYLKLPGNYPITQIRFPLHRLPKVAERFVQPS